MQIKFNKYTKELNEIVNLLNHFPKIQTISAKDMKKYQILVERKEFLQREINDMLNKRTDILCNYNDKIRTWLASPMNCRKYYKLEQSASYSRDLALYKTGFLKKPPLPPFIQNCKNYISENLLEPLSDTVFNIKSKFNSNWKSISKKSPICKSIIKSKKYIKNDLPINLTHLAINCTKKCIVSYRHFSNSIHTFSRNISSSPSVKTLSYILNQAKQEADIEQNSFISRIKVNPNTFEYTNKYTHKNGYYGLGNPIIPPKTETPIFINRRSALTSTHKKQTDLSL